MHELGLSSQVGHDEGDACLEWFVGRGEVWLSDHLRRTFGYEDTPDMVPRAWFCGRIHPDELPDIERSMGSLLTNRGERQWSSDFRFRRGDGRYVPVHLAAMVVRDDAGKAFRVVGAVRDDSAARAAARELAASEERFRTVADTAVDAMLIADESLRIIFGNAAAERLFGLPKELLTGRDLTSIMPERCREFHGRALRAGDEQGENPVFGRALRVAVLTADGGEVPVELTVTSWMAGGSRFLTGVFRDVSARVEQELRHTIEREVDDLLAEPREDDIVSGVFVRILAERLESYSALYLRSGDSLDFVAASGTMPATELARRLRMLIEEAVTAPATLHIRHAGHDLIAAPMRADGEAVGVVLVARAGRPFDAWISRIVETAGVRYARQLRNRRAEADLRSSVERLADAQRIARMGTWEVDAATGRATWSDEVYHTLGLGTGEVAPSLEVYLERVHPDDRERVLAMITSIGATPDSSYRSIEHRIVRPDGTEAAILIRLHALFDDGGWLLRVIGTVQDVTEQFHARSHMQWLSEVNRMILDSAAEGIIGVDRHGRPMFTNPAALSILGRTDEELIGFNLHELVHHTRPTGEPYPASECAAAKTALDGTPRYVTGESYWRKDGQPVPVEYACAAMRRDGEIVGVVVTFRDVSAQKQLQVQLDNAQRVAALGRIAATIAHEFRNVLMGIQPYVELLRRRMGDDERVRLAVEPIGAALRRGRGVTEEILRFSAPVMLRVQPVDFAGWLEKLAPELRAQAGERVRVVMEVPATPLEIAFDPSQMQQVITNLVVNARQAVPGRGLIKVSVGELDRELARSHGIDDPERFIRCSISDTGSGIDAEVLGDIFEPTFTTKRNGTGLGLPFAREVVQRHGGRLVVESASGIGTTFHLLLPRT